MEPRLDPKFTVKCVQCINPLSNVEEASLCLFITEKTKVVLRSDDQSWLGRCVVVPLAHVPKGCNMYLKYSESAIDLEDCKDRLFKTYQALFDMTIDNQAQLGNLTRDENGQPTSIPEYYHVHHHFIPRYATGAKWNGEVYLDAQWGKALNIDPDSGHRKLSLSREKLRELKETIQLKMIEMKLVSWKELERALPTDRVRQAAQQAGLTPPFSYS